VGPTGSSQRVVTATVPAKLIAIIGGGAGEYPRLGPLFDERSNTYRIS